MRGLRARDGGVRVPHERVPDLDGAPALEDVDPDGAPATQSATFKADRTVRPCCGECLLGKALVVISEQLVQRLRVGLDVEFHLPLLHDLCAITIVACQIRVSRGGRGEARCWRDGMRGVPRSPPRISYALCRSGAGARAA